MGKKKSGASLGIVYLVGMAVALIGFCCPMFTGLFKSTANGFKFINFDNSGFVTIGALVLLIGVACGTVLGLCSLLKIKIPSAKLLGLVAVIAAAVGAAILIIGFTTNGGVYKVIGKQFLKHATYGFYMVIAGWVVALAGYLTGK